MAERKLGYKQVPKALRQSSRLLWRISPAYVLSGGLEELLNRATGLIYPFLLAAITTRLPLVASDEQARREIVIFIIAIAAVPAVRSIISASLSIWRMRLDVKVSSKLRSEFYSAYVRIPFHYYEDKEALDSFNIAETFLFRLSGFGHRAIFSMAGAIFSFIAAAIALISIHWSVFLVYSLLLPLTLWQGLRYNKALANVNKENRTLMRQVWAIEALFYPRFIKETRTLGIADALMQRRNKIDYRQSERNIVVEKRLEKLNIFTLTLSNLAEMTASLIAVWRIAFRGAPIGSFVIAQQFASRATGALQEMFDLMRRFDEDLYGYAEYLFITNELQPKQRAITTVDGGQDLAIKEVTFAYQNSDKPVIRNVSLEIKSGDHIAIVGENGAGKSTLITILLGLLSPQLGKITYGSNDIADIEERVWLKNIGVMPQEIAIKEDHTIRDFLWYGDITKNRSDDSVFWDLLKTVELEDYVKKLPKQLDTYLGTWVEENNGTELSGGQYQRLAIARTLFRNPDILILDEPTSAIDALAEQRIIQSVLKTRENRTTIIISHRFNTVRKAGKIIFMDKGQITESGTHNELMKLNGNYAHMFTVQAEGYK